jgi:DNA-directed RNA polymerase subunit L
MASTPKITNRLDDPSTDTLTFTISGVDVSIVNAIRRTIMADIPTAVFITSPHEESRAVVYSNTSKLNNELLLQRLSCVPIHANPSEIDAMKNYLLELNVENLSDTIRIVTTEDFRIKNTTTDTYIKESEVHKLFPPDPLTSCYIDLVRLCPKVTAAIPGEKVHFTCEFSVSTAAVSGMFNVASTCSYGYTVDTAKQQLKLDELAAKWGADGLDVDFERKNWLLLDGRRCTIENSFDFILQSIGVYSNMELVRIACEVLERRLAEDTNEMPVMSAPSTMDHAFDITVAGKYTVGKILEHYLYALFFEGDASLTFCGFKMMHPHDNHGILRIAFKENVDVSVVHAYVKRASEAAIEALAAIRGAFSASREK